MLKKSFFALLMTATAAASVFAAPAATAEAAKTVAEKKLPNLMANSNFDGIKKLPGNWRYWRPNRNAKLTIDEKAGFNGTGGVVMSGDKAALFSYFTIQPGSKLFMRAKVCKFGEAKASVSLRFHKQNGSWHGRTVSQKVKFGKDGEWTTVEMVVVAPKDAYKAVPMLDANSFASPESKVIFDELEVYDISGTAK